MDLSSIARQLLSARQSATTLAPPSDASTDFSLADGYTVGKMLAEQRITAGDESVGVKLGFTNTTAWESLGISDPFWAPMYDTSVSGDHDVSLAGLMQPRIEPEIVLGFDKALPAGTPAAEVAGAVTWIALGFEIVHCHFPGWQMTAADAIADFGLHAQLLLGPRHAPADGEVDGLPGVQVTLRQGAEEAATGTGANTLGGPVAAVERLLQLPGYPGLGAGAMVTTGTLTAAQPLVVGQEWTQVTSGLTGPSELSIRTTE